MKRALKWRRLVVYLSLLAAIAVANSSQPVFAAETARFEPLTPPRITAGAVYVTDATSGTELFARNADTPLPPASLTKLVAALVVVERAKLDDVVEITQNDLVDAEE